jgi:DNA-binding response OmpR family regulator/alkylhydroperoxidase/carboxymuconolactone decarboxylase family protein YurZ
MTGDAASILIVEDEPPIRRLLRTTLSAHDYRIIEAATGAEALSALRHHRPDLVLLDLGLPDIDGLVLIGKIRALGPVPIVVLSSRGDEAAKVTALDSGADDYVTKPFGADELLARIRAALRHRLQQQGAERTFASDDLSVDLIRRLVRRGPEDVKLSPKEYDILEQLVIHGRSAVSAGLCPPTAPEDRGRPVRTATCSDRARNRLPAGLREGYAPANFQEGTMAESENYKKGTEVRRTLMGAAHADKMNATVYDDPIMKKFGDYAREAVFGMLWTRPGLDMKTRALICVISDTSQARWPELAIHLRMARNQGWTEDELAEALMHLCGYIGLPSVREALLTAKEVFHEMNNEK